MSRSTAPAPNNSMASHSGASIPARRTGRAGRRLDVIRRPTLLTSKALPLLEAGAEPQSDGPRPSGHDAHLRAAAACREPDKVVALVEQVRREELGGVVAPTVTEKRIDQGRCPDPAE